MYSGGLDCLYILTLRRSLFGLVNFLLTVRLVSREKHAGEVCNPLKNVKLESGCNA